MLLHDFSVSLFCSRFFLFRFFLFFFLLLLLCSLAHPLPAPSLLPFRPHTRSYIMRFAIAVSALAMAASVMAAPWKPLGGDLAYIGPVFNATFKAGDTIPLEYTFYTGKTVSLNNTTNATAPAAPIMTGIFTLLSYTPHEQQFGSCCGEKRGLITYATKYSGEKVINHTTKSFVFSIRFSYFDLACLGWTDWQQDPGGDSGQWPQHWTVKGMPEHRSLHRQLLPQARQPGYPRRCLPQQLQRKFMVVHRGMSVVIISSE